jgi:hypothetical protein
VNALLRFLMQYEILIYIVLAVGAAFVARSLLKAWSEWRTAVFGLEKELSFQRVRVSGSILILLAMIALSQFCLVTFIAPFLPASSFIATPTVDLTQTPGVPLLADTLSAGASTVSPPPGTEGCVPGKLMISSPKPGEEIQGKIVLLGTVRVESFGFFKYEYAPQGSGQWATIAARDKVVPEIPSQAEGELGAWDTSQLTPGDYQLRLVVTDNVGNSLPPCILSVHVLAP